MKVTIRVRLQGEVWMPSNFVNEQTPIVLDRASDGSPLDSGTARIRRKVKR